MPRIRETLSHLSLQKTDASLSWEVILVDNASTDNTIQVAQDHWKSLDIPVKLSIVKEIIPGLSNARATGIKSSLHDVIILCDDDNWLFENYVQTAFETIQSEEQIGAVGGEGIAKAHSMLPDWFDEYKGYYACYAQAKETGELTDPNAFLFGAGLVVRKQIATRLYMNGRFLMTDRVGEKLISGGDNELCYLLRLTGYKLWYDEQLKFYHFMPKQRLTIEYLYKLINAVAYSSMKLVIYHYVLMGKDITRFTWLYDVTYRFYYLLLATARSVFLKNKFKRRISISSSWNSFIAVVDQFGQYRKTSKNISNLKNEEYSNGISHNASL